MSRSSRKIPKFYVMKREFGAAGGYIRIGSYRSQSKAEKIVNELDSKIKGQRTGFYNVWTQEQIDNWLNL